jgi:hypothetical protein
MKKILTILALSLIAITSMSAKSAQVQLNTSVDSTPVSYELYYNNDKIEDNTTEYDIFISRSLTEGGQTQDFTIVASSNLNSDLSVNVEIKPEAFETTLNGSTPYKSNITPSVNQINSVSTLSAGLNKDKLVNKFNLSWGGNKELPAGDYVSNVTINYSIN